MGLTTTEVTKATDTIDKLTKDGITINVDDTTIQSTGIYLIITGAVVGFTAALFITIFRKLFG